MKIFQANENHAEAIGILFDLYRQFYACDPDRALATDYIRARLKAGDSTIFAAMDGEQTLGFVQLYPSFCSVQACRIYILYDLYVIEQRREAGVGRALMERAREFALHNGAERIDLLTAKNNHAGQHLYEKLGYVKTLQDFYAYSLAL